jgi:hypothetical protein
MSIDLAAHPVAVVVVGVGVGRVGLDRGSSAAGENAPRHCHGKPMKSMPNPARYEQLEAIVDVLTEISQQLYELSRELLFHDLDSLIDRCETLGKPPPRPTRRRAIPSAIPDSDIPF